MTVHRHPADDGLRVLIVGGGVAALEALLALRVLAEDRVAVTLIAPSRRFTEEPYSVLAPFGGAGPPSHSLARIVAAAGAQQLVDSVTAVDPVARRVQTAGGCELGFDALLVAVGGRRVEGLPGALTFSGGESTAEMRALLERVVAGEIRHVTFATPGVVTWPLPVYELALLTARRIRSRGLTAQVMLVTPEQRPLALFGPEASDALDSLLSEAGVEVRCAVHPIRFEDGELTVVAADPIATDAVVSTPCLEGPALAGLPFDGDGFIPVDRYCRVSGFATIYAAGECTALPIKQGGIAAQQAETAASSIAAQAGALVTRKPFRPVLRGALVTNGGSVFMRAPAAASGTTSSESDRRALWWPPAKVAARHLAPFLNGTGIKAGLSPEPPADGAVPIDVDLSHELVDIHRE